MASSSKHFTKVNNHQNIEMHLRYFSITFPYAITLKFNAIFFNINLDGF